MSNQSNQSVTQFYSDLAEDYHSMYADWQSELRRQGKILDSLIRRYVPKVYPRVLDCMCGIGTQTLGLALQGYQLTSTDLVPSAVAKAKKEAELMGVSVNFQVADVRRLDSVVAERFDVVLSCDNGFSHLMEDSALEQAAVQVFARLNKDGIVLISIRDYDQVLQERAASHGVQLTSLPGSQDLFASKIQPAMPRVFEDRDGLRRIVFQVWEWAEDDRSYTFHHFHIKQDAERNWQTKCYKSQLRALRRSELTNVLQKAGFGAVEWLMPDSSGYYQPIVIGRRV